MPTCVWIKFHFMPRRRRLREKLYKDLLFNTRHKRHYLWRHTCIGPIACRRLVFDFSLNVIYCLVVFHMKYLNSALEKKSWKCYLRPIQLNASLNQLKTNVWKFHFVFFYLSSFYLYQSLFADSISVKSVHSLIKGTFSVQKGPNLNLFASHLRITGLSLCGLP